MSFQDLASTTISFGGSAVDTCDPDFAFPRSSAQYAIPLWLVGAAALTVACAAAVLTRDA
ncbi:MAG: hypothetical protein GX960_07500 [Actinomycetales bacterium]|nr:hypothetical protein [Actinomycetales bacterium]